MDRDQQEQVALHRWAVIAEAANSRLSPAERGAAVRAAAARTHTHPDQTARWYSRGTIDTAHPDGVATARAPRDHHSRRRQAARYACTASTTWWPQIPQP